MLNNWFQTEECYNFYKSLSFLEAFKYEVRRDGEVKGRIVGYIQKDGGRIKQFFSRRAIINGGPFLSDDITEIEISELLEKCKAGLKGKAIYVETRNFDDYSEFLDTFEKKGFEYAQHYDIKIDCTNWDDVEHNIGKHRRRYIRLSIKNEAHIVENPSFSQIGEFYTILRNLYETKIKTPLWPIEFFEKLYYSPFGKFILIEYKGIIIGGSACVIRANDTMYEWFACGNNKLIKNVFPSSLVKLGGMRYSFDHKIPIFDMMGAGSPNDGGYGVRDFKQEFGGELVEYGRFKCILSPVLYDIGKMAIKIIRKR